MENIFKKAQELLNNDVYWFKIKKGEETLLEVDCYNDKCRGKYTEDILAEEIGHDKEIAVRISNDCGKVNEWAIFCEKNPNLFDKFDEFAKKYLYEKCGFGRRIYQTKPNEVNCLIVLL